jgi:hypothetical protein
MQSATKVATREEYFESLSPERRRDIEQIDALIREIAPDLKPGYSNGYLGYGPYHYKYASGREGDSYHIGLASQKQYISIYCCAVVDGAYVADRFRDRLPKANIGKSCVRFKRLDDLNPEVVRELIRETAACAPMGG